MGRYGRRGKAAGQISVGSEEGEKMLKKRVLVVTRV
jgi:hypothetical protein